MLIVHAPPTLCHRLLRPGECKRVLPAGILVGYQFRAPCCKRLGIYPGGWVESAGWVDTIWRGVLDEDDDEETERVVRHPSKLSHESFLCQGCGRAVVIVENEIVLG